MGEATKSGTEDPRWRGLFKLGGIAALITAVLLVCELIVFSVWRQPETVTDYFELFQDNWFVALLDLDLLGMVAYILFVPVMLALYIALRRASEALAAVGTALFFVGIAAFFATNTAFSLFVLSNNYAAATTTAERAMFLAAGQAALTTFQIGAFQVSYVIVSIAWLTISVVMVRSATFSTLTAWSGIMAGAGGIAGVAIEHTPVLGSILPLLLFVYFSAIVLLAVWVALVCRRLWRLGVEDHA